MPEPQPSQGDLSRQWVLTAVGPDRPGIVDDLTGHLHAGGANLLDSRMVNLRGQFAVVLLMEFPDAAAGEKLAAELPQVGRGMGLRADVAHQAPPPRRTSPPPAGVPYRLKTYSTDRPGIVHGVAHLLQQHGVNIEELETRQESAPFAGTPLFLMEMRLTVPQGVPLRKLRGELETLCDSLNCDVDLEPA